MTESFANIVKKNNQTSSTHTNEDVDISKLVAFICEKLKLKLNQPLGEDYKIICKDVLIANSLDIRKTMDDMRMIISIPSDDVPSVSEYEESFHSKSLPEMFESIYDQLLDGDLIQTSHGNITGCEEQQLICDTLFKDLSISSLEVASIKNDSNHGSTKSKQWPESELDTSETKAIAHWWQLGDIRSTQMVARDLVRDLFSKEEVSDLVLDTTLHQLNYDIESCVDCLCRGGLSMSGPRRTFLDALTHNMQDQRYATSITSESSYLSFPTGQQYTLLPATNNSIRTLNTQSNLESINQKMKIESEGTWTTVITKKNGAIESNNPNIHISSQKSNSIKSSTGCGSSNSGIQISIKNSDSPGRIKSSVEDELQQNAWEMVSMFTRAHLAAQTRAGAPLAQYLAAQGREAKRRFMRADSTLALLALQRGNPHLRISLVELEDGRPGHSECVLLFEGKKADRSVDEPVSVRGRRSRPHDLTCDLHGVNVRQGIRFLNAVLSYCRNSGHSWRLEFVVGRGLHSFRGAPKLGPRILTYLNSRGIKDGIKDATLCNGHITFCL